MMAVLEFMNSVLRYALPVLFVAFGILLNQKAGIVNIGAEGMMLVGALAGVAFGYIFGSGWLGVLAAMAVVGIFGLLFAMLVLKFQVNDIVLGVAFNIFASGLCTLLFRSGVGVKRIGNGMAFGGMLMAVIAVGVMLHVFLYHTLHGLKLRTSGEYSQTAGALGLNISRYRYGGFVCGCTLIGFGGACLSLGQMNLFVEDMTNGRGYIALAAVAFGRATPLGTALAVLIFGIGEAVQYRLQAAQSGIPHQFALMVPYILTILGLIILQKHRRK